MGRKRVKVKATELQNKKKAKTFDIPPKKDAKVSAHLSAEPPESMKKLDLKDEIASIKEIPENVTKKIVDLSTAAPQITTQ